MVLHNEIMKANGFESDIPLDVARESHIKLITAPDSPDSPTAVEQTWDYLTRVHPNVRHEIARIALEYGGSDPDARGRVTKSLVSLYVVLKDAADIAEFNDQLSSATEGTTQEIVQT